MDWARPMVGAQHEPVKHRNRLSPESLHAHPAPMTEVEMHRRGGRTGVPRLVALVLLAVFAPGEVAAQRCATPASGQQTQATNARFYPHRPGTQDFDVSWRDCEFMWDSLYATGLTPAIRQTLDTLGAHLVDRQGTSPVAVDGYNTWVVYDYLNREGRTYVRDASSATNGMRLGASSDPAEDYSHADAYITDWAHDQGGKWPAGWQTDDEDVSSGHASGDVLHANSFHMGGPARSQPTDPTGTGWTKPGSAPFVRFNHEMSHSLPLAGGGGAYGEMWSAAAEVIGGIDHVEAGNYEVPYTWSLMAWADAATQPPPGVGFRYSLSNYQGRTSWMAYLAYNFLNADTNRTLAGMRDDLVYRWNRSLNSIRLDGLMPLLSDAQCKTCSTKTYFRPQGVPLGNVDRLGLIHHNWRVANFVNNPSLAEGQYGYPAWGRFSPALNQKAWQSIDGDPLDDIVALPAVVNLGETALQRDTVFKGVRSFRGSEYPLALVPYGSNYWVVRPTGPLLAADRELVMRITPEAFYRTCNVPVLWPRRGVRLMASAVAYDRIDSGGEESILWQHPESAVLATAVAWVDADSTATDLRLVVPSFGLTHKAIVLVITLADDANGKFAGMSDVPYDEAMPYRLEIGVASTPAPSLSNFAVGAVAGTPDDWPTWSPAGDEIAYSSIVPPDYAQIYRRRLDGSAPVRVSPQAMPQYEPDWSPGGDRIAWATLPQSGRMDVWVADLSAPGSPPTQLTNQSGASTFPAFQPNGQGLAYIYERAAPADTAWELRWVGVDGTGDRLVTTFPYSGQYPYPLFPIPPRWTRDGQHLVVCDYVTRRFYRCPASGGPAVLVSGPALDLFSFDLPPGNGRLAITDRTHLTNRYLPGQADCDQASESWLPSIALNRIALLDTALATRDTAHRFVERGVTAFNLRWSPDGTQIAYSRSRYNATGDRDLWVGRTTWNRAPALAASVEANYSILTCAPFELTLYASDPDGDPLTFEASYLPAGAQVQSGHTVYWPYPVAGMHWFVARALDPQGGVASRVVRVQVDSAYYCGGGGGEDPPPIEGGPHAIRQAESNRMIGGDGTGLTRIANTFLDGALPGQWQSQTVRLMAPRADEAGHVATRVVALRPGALRLDRVRLLVAEHAPGTVAAATEDGVVTGQKIRPERMATEAGEDLSTSLAGADGDTRHFAAGATLDLEWPSGTAVAGVLLDCARASTADPATAWGVRLDVHEAAAWRSVGRIHPRSGFDLLAAPLGAATRARLTFVTDTYVREVAGYTHDAGNTGTVTVVPLSGTDAEAGVERLATADESALDLAQGRKAALLFDGPAALEGVQRTFFLELVAAVVSDGAAAMSGRGMDEAPPARFALHANRPNPFGGGTTIHFEVPRAGLVRVEVFDAQGRRVATLADGRFGPGTHAVRWDGTDASGARVKPGVYLLRMVGDGFRAQQRMVLLGR